MIDKLQLEQPPQSPTNDERYAELFQDFDFAALEKLVRGNPKIGEVDQNDLIDQLQNLFGDEFKIAAEDYLKKFDPNHSICIFIKDLIKPAVYRALNLIGKNLYFELQTANIPKFYDYYKDINEKRLSTALMYYQLQIYEVAVENAITTLLVKYDSNNSEIPAWVINIIKVNQTLLYLGNLRRDVSSPTNRLGSIGDDNILLGLSTAFETLNLVPILYSLNGMSSLAFDAKVGVITAFVSGLTKFDISQVSLIIAAIGSSTVGNPLLRFDSDLNKIEFIDSQINAKYGFVSVGQVLTTPDSSQSAFTKSCPFRGGGNLISLLIHPIVDGMVQILLEQSIQNQTNKNENKI